MAAVKKSGSALDYANEDLKKDKDFVLKVLKQNGRALQFAHPDLKKDTDVVLAAVRQNGGALQFAHPDLKKDTDVVLAAVKQSGRALWDAHPDLMKDKEFFKTHIIKNLEPKTMIEAFCEFSKSADESDINDVLIVISKRCLDNKDYSKALLGHYNSEKLSKKLKIL